MSRSEVIANISKTKELVDNGYFAGAANLIGDCFEKVVSYNFYPLLDSILDLKETIDKNTNHIELSIFDTVLRQSRLIRSPKSEELFDRFLEESKTCSKICLPIHERFVRIFPIATKLRFPNTEVSTGKDIEFDLHLESFLTKNIHCDDINIEFTVDDGQPFVHSLGPRDLSNLTPTKISGTFTPPPKKRMLRAASINLVVNNITLTFESTFTEKIFIIPDESSCKIDVSMPTQCVIGTKLPLKITITSGDLTLHNVQTSFIYEQSQSAITLSGTYNGNPIEKVNNLGDMEANSTINLDLSIMTHVELQTAIMLTVSFNTDEFGTGVFKKPLKFNFISPFKTKMEYLNQDFEVQILPVIDNPDASVIIETTLTNVLSIPITISFITGTIDFFDINCLPSTVKPKESFTFLGQTSNPIFHEILVDFHAEGIDEGSICFKTPEIKQDLLPIQIKYEAPDCSTINDVIDCKIIIERGQGLPNESELLNFTLCVEKTPNFFLEGPGKLNFHMWRNQKKEIPIKYIPLTTGFLYLPKINIPELNKSYVSQITVAYQ
ncbi:hypothetical protein TVAG_039870 [Trichomonas vaginalis G3]|uniref:Trafficking protein particle complex subunit 11 C-terminal domain-containing protein n=1 Tax=Trichomonas vaginalis (strain ATCC PRA-98 / G3) TaxID=412133 RepID=A2EQW1_TRIV3|nr:foie gras family [Trichomonas vaginalis G3]EAY04935.1 hypothetical protein TVAG_039870 [Trichomonas vaginalis G3]KAI5508781.1 foie gras family [Trichomonas vaginalis G3]|eukprot:XP_001317158.1 hypothetical protein [Trichomonas vaginalis G3]